jgi:hypothetical protein
MPLIFPSCGPVSDPGSKELEPVERDQSRPDANPEHPIDDRSNGKEAVRIDLGEGPVSRNEENQRRYPEDECKHPPQEVCPPPHDREERHRKGNNAQSTDLVTRTPEFKQIHRWLPFSPIAAAFDGSYCPPLTPAMPWQFYLPDL